MNRETKSEGQMNGRADYVHTLIGSFFELLVGGGLLNEIQDLIEHMYGQSMSLLVFSGNFCDMSEGKEKRSGVGGTQDRGRKTHLVVQLSISHRPGLSTGVGVGHNVLE